MEQWLNQTLVPFFPLDSYTFGTLGLMALFPLLLGGLSTFSHCIGMCGPIAMALHAQSQNENHSLWKYHLGRMVSYTLLGFVSGTLGSLFHPSSYILQHVPQFFLVFKIVVVLLLLYMAFLYGGFLPPVLTLGLSSHFTSKLRSRFLRPFLNRGFFPMGFATGFLPCPTLYVMLAWSLSLNSPWLGALAMMLLSVTTLPGFVVLWSIVIPFRKKIPWSLHQSLSILLFALSIWQAYNLLSLPSNQESPLNFTCYPGVQLPSNLPIQESL